MLESNRRYETKMGETNVCWVRKSGSVSGPSVVFGPSPGVLLVSRWWRCEGEGGKKDLEFSPSSSMTGAMRNVTPTSSMQVTSNRPAVMMIVHLARCGRSSGCTVAGGTCWRGPVAFRRSSSPPNLVVVFRCFLFDRAFAGRSAA